MRRSGLLHRALIVTAIGAVSAAPLLSSVAASGATPGTWGVQQAAYLDGTVCSSNGLTSPLASWDFGDTAPEFLLNAVTSNGITDSAQLPQASAPGRLVQPVSAGQYGLNSPTDVSTYAALISLFGSGPDPDASEVARAILDVAAPGTAPDCVISGAGLVAQAAQLAGPYTVTITSASAQVAAGGADVLTVSVRNTSGAPVPGAAVTLASTESIFGAASTQTVRTDASGTARATITVPQDPSLSTLAVTATASVSVGLEAATVQSGFGQQYVGAIFADPPTAYSANVTIPVSQGAAPVLTARLASPALVKGGALALSEQLSGMFGHAGHLTFQIQGPVKLDPTALCSNVSAASFTASTPTAATSSLDVVGDSLLSGGTWQPAAIGCYLLRSSVVTTNATPQAQASAKPTVLTVLDTTAVAAPTHIVIGPGAPITETVKVTNSYQRPGQLATSLLGPMVPGNGDCHGVDWSKAKSTTVAATNTSGDGSYTIASPALTKTGCYQVQSSMVLNVAAHESARVPLTSSAPSGLFYVLQPTVTAAAAETSVVSPASVQAAVTVLNTFGQGGHVVIETLQVPADQFGCRSADFSHATVVGDGAPVVTSGDGTVQANSTATAKLGCYALVPKLVMDANSALVATGTPTIDDVVLVGEGAVPPAPRAVSRVDSSLTGTYVALGIFLALLLSTAYAVFRYVSTEYSNEGRDDEDDRPSPFGSRLSSLFSPPPPGRP